MKACFSQEQQIDLQEAYKEFLEGSRAGNMTPFHQLVTRSDLSVVIPIILNQSFPFSTLSFFLSTTIYLSVYLSIYLQKKILCVA